jgi:hypothetical protein
MKDYVILFEVDIKAESREEAFDKANKIGHQLKDQIVLPVMIYDVAEALK